MFFNLREKAREIFQGYIFADMCDFSYNLRGFTDIYTEIIKVIDPELSKNTPQKEIIEKLERSIKVQIANLPQTLKDFKETFALKQGGAVSIEKK
jgi:hypothetical protein